MNKCKIIAEICCNHNGDVDVCKKMILEAKKNGANAVKLQKRDVDLWKKIKPSIYNNPHPNPSDSYGDTYYLHRKFLEFDLQTHKQIKDFCDENNISYGCSVFDVPSAKEIISINPGFIKIPSPANNNYELIKYVCKNFKGEIHISFGMTYQDEFEKIIGILRKENVAGRSILYVCTSGYPITCKDVHLLDIKKYKELYADFKAIGYSGHINNFAIDVASYVLGAEFIERHFTLDRAQKGTDHKLSILPNELNELRCCVDDVFEAMNERLVDIADVEKSNRSKLKWINM